MSLTAEQKAKITDPSVLEGIEDLEKEVATRNFEASDRRTKLKKAEDEKKTLEGKYGSITEKMKKLGFDPDDDLETQLPTLLDKMTKERGMKPSADFEKAMKQIEKLTGEVTEWKTTAEREKKEAQVEKASTLFDPALAEIFGPKFAPIVKENLRLKGAIVLKEGIPGIQSGEDFFPLVAGKGESSAIDHLKTVYADFVVTKQKGGAGGSPSNKGARETGKEMVDRATWETYGPAEKIKYMATVGQFSDNVE